MILISVMQRSLFLKNQLSSNNQTNSTVQRGFNRHAFVFFAVHVTVFGYKTNKTARASLCLAQNVPT